MGESIAFYRVSCPVRARGRGRVCSTQARWEGSRQFSYSS